MPSQADDKRQAAREVIDILHEISTLLVRDTTPTTPSIDFTFHSSAWRFLSFLLYCYYCYHRIF